MNTPAKNTLATHTYTAFNGHQLLASGTLPAAALAFKHALETGATGPVLLFDNRNGRSIDVDTRGSDDDVLARLGEETRQEHAASAAATEPAAEEPRGRGRPKLGVVPREVTLLPRHWDWLAAQPGGASVALRKLVEEARRAQGDKDNTRKAQERSYHFMSAMAGDLPGFEDASRALFAGDHARLAHLAAVWPEDVRAHTLWLAGSDLEAPHG
ncbi:DUF2239 family protein [Undibacterium sp. TJN25]|uniref:DUF2239 family protein n=1 Tax=Undibacterium sp. TJN25 TaxID=3413056 RepID=UPI003BF29240